MHAILHSDENELMIDTGNNYNESPALIQSETKSMVYDSCCNGEMFRNENEINSCQRFGMTKEIAML